MNDKQQERWRKIRQMGRKRYILFFGVLGWGVFTAVFWSIWMGWGRGWPGILSYLAIAIIVFPIAGYFWGAWMWNWSEKQLAKAQPMEADDPA